MTIVAFFNSLLAQETRLDRVIPEKGAFHKPMIRLWAADVLRLPLYPRGARGRTPRTIATTQ